MPNSAYFEKELSPRASRPLVLAEFQFLDGSKFMASTAPLNSSEGGFPYNNVNYFCRISDQQIGALAARSSDGIDRFPSCSIVLADPDKTLYTTYENVAGRGFRGANLILRLVFWQADTANFSTDSEVIFNGICDAPEYNMGLDLMTVKANASRNLARIYFPIFQVGQRCGNVFPANAFQRLDGATNMMSPCWGCGYSPDQNGTDPEIGGAAQRGNLGAPNQTRNNQPLTDSQGVFVTCNYTKQDCVDRGMYSVDGSGRATGRFTGNQWAPQNRAESSKSYLLGKTQLILQGQNPNAYTQRFPMTYGTQWVTQPVIVSIPADANSTRWECSICQDDLGFDGILQVVVNGVIVPRNGSSPDNKLFRWNFVGDASLGTHIGGSGGTPPTVYATGGRNGAACNDAEYDSKGDPHGSVATIEIVVYSQLAQAGSVPNTMVLQRGTKCKTPNSANAGEQATWPKVRTNNPAFVILDIAGWAGIQYSQWNLQTILDEAAWSNQLIPYSDLNGNSATHAAYICEIALQQQRSASDVLQATLRSFNAQITRNPSTGLYELLIRKGLADQQPTAVPGSNWNNAVTSIKADGSGGQGYAAYLIDESVIQKDGLTGNPKVQLLMDASANAPNRITFSFQDADNTYSLDSLSDVDADAVFRAGGYVPGNEGPTGSEVEENWNVLGISNFDQGTRIINTYLSEIQRGNENQDTRGTRRFAVELTVRAAHLRPGHLVIFSYQQLQLRPHTQLQSPPGTPIPGILCRVEKVEPIADFERCTVTLRWHEDLWYTWAYSQKAAPLNSQPGSQKPDRPPYPWQPYGAQPSTGDSVYGLPPSPTGSGHYTPDSWYSFGIAQDNTASDGTVSGSLIGAAPVNLFSSGLSTPVLATIGTSASSGGSIPGALTLYFGVTAIDSAGFQTPLSHLFTVTTQAGTNTNTISSPTIYWDANTVAYALYGGTDSNNLTAQFSGTGAPSQINITSLAYETWGPPDVLADSIELSFTQIVHGGLWADAVAAVASNNDGTGTLTFNPPSPFPDGQWVDYDITLLGRAEGDTSVVPIANYRVSGNTGGNLLTVSPDPSGTIKVGDLMMLLTKPDSITHNTIGESNFVNAYAATGLTVNEGSSFVLRIVAGTGMGHSYPILSNTATAYTINQDWITTPDATSKFVILNPADAGNSQAIKVSNSAGAVVSTWPFDLTSFEGTTVLIEASILDAQGKSSLDAFAPYRMLYVYPNPLGAVDGGAVTYQGTSVPY